MPTYKDFKLPDLGEGLTEGEILRWLVQPGDEVALNQPIVEVETAKAAVEIPSPYAGVVSQLHHNEGDTVDVGSPIITFDVDAAGEGSAAATPVSEPPAHAAAIQGGDMVPAVPREPGLVGSPAPRADTEEKIQVLVGSGPKAGQLTRRARKPAAAAAAAPQHRASRASSAGVSAHAERVVGGVTVLAKPPVRKLARDLGVDLHAVTGTGPNGTITRDDVESAASVTPAVGAATAPARQLAERPAYDPATREQRIPIKGVLKNMAAAMVASAFTAPHVTEFTNVDMTPTMQLVARLRTMPDYDGVKVSPLLVVAKALLVAVKRNPRVNATWDEGAGELVVKEYVNLGIAAATPRGLIVPNVKDADALTLPELAVALNELTATAREGRTTPADMQRGTITITNVGVFGVDTGTPIINPGEGAILAFGAVRDMPWVHEGQIAIRKVAQLGLSFDHRFIDGQLGSQFLSDIAALLADPSLFAAWG
jgi:pyruvate dehydrogenase E2 component (dihydrolipoamide acetyltransferase)